MSTFPSQSSLETWERRPGEAPNVREAKFDDYAQIASLQSRYGFESKSYDQWVHLWIHNPLYCELSDWPIGWVLEGESQEIVGYIENIPLPYEFLGRRIVAATSQAWVVDSRFRSHAFSLLRRFFGQVNVDLFLNTTVNAQATAGHEALRETRVPVGAWDQSVFWITDYRGFVTAYLAKKGVSDSRFLRSLLSLGLRAKDTIAKKSSRFHWHRAAVRCCTNFDIRFDTFWEDMRLRNSRVLRATRSRRMLEWRFRSALAENRAWVLTVEDWPRLAAYAIFLRRDNREFGLNRLRLIDFQALDGKNELLVPMLSWALDRCRREGIHMLEVIGFGPGKQRIIDSIAPHRRALSSWLYFYKTNDPYLAKALTDVRSWDPSCFDGDASL
jgi:hypothetical protein